MIQIGKKISIFGNPMGFFFYPNSLRGDLILQKALISDIPIELRMIIMQYYGKYGYIEYNVYPYLAEMVSKLYGFEKDYKRFFKDSTAKPSEFSYQLFEYDHIGICTDEEDIDDDKHPNYLGNIFIDIYPTLLLSYLNNRNI
jgi:hypothetical protein